MIHITTRTETLTDGSKVYDVLIYQETMVLEFHCASERDALGLEAKLTRAIQDHTVDMVKLEEWT